MHDGKGAVERRPLFSLPIVFCAFSFSPLPSLPTSQRTPLGKVVKLSDCFNKAFSSSPGPLYQNEVKCSAFDMEMIFHCHASKTHFHKCALDLIWKWGVLELGGRWPIHMTVKMTFANSDYLTENQTGAELPLRGGGGGWGFPRLLWSWSPATYMGNKGNVLNVYFPALQLYLPSNLKS